MKTFCPKKNRQNVYKNCFISPIVGRMRFREVSSRRQCKLGPLNDVRNIISPVLEESECI